MTLTLTTEQAALTASAFYTALERWRECATEIAASDLPEQGKRRLVEQFERQIKQGREILEVLE